jgi:phosphoglycolate phosphatase-like HAD superfamily hydrolase
MQSHAFSVSSMAVVGDTASDMQAGRRAGSKICIGVRTGTDDEQRLRESGACEVVDSVADLDHALSLRRAFNW